MTEELPPIEEQEALAPVTLETERYRKALLVGCYKNTEDKPDCEDYLKELSQLAEILEIEVVGKEPCPLREINASTYLGSGKIEELIERAKELAADVIIFDEAISPSQQRNLEEVMEMPVIDRTQVILDVFSRHAKTREARLQIQLAQIKYRLPRLKRLWTHLQRQSGSGQNKGEGEKQLELDKRILEDRALFLSQQIKDIAKQRTIRRQLRNRTDVPSFAIVGYTNAGKSTLLNALTSAGVLAKDQLFATLDTTTRRFIMPSRQEVVLTDTVGFIRKLPHTLVTSFKSTLEESVDADYLIHLVDCSHPQADDQAETSLKVLKELRAANKPIITALNKVDQCQDQAMINKLRLSYPKTVLISALTGQGIPDLLEKMSAEIARSRKTLHLRIPQSEYQLVTELMTHGTILEQDYEENDILIKVQLSAEWALRMAPYEIPS